MNRRAALCLTLGMMPWATLSAMAQSAPPPEVMEEVIVTAPRNGEPDFQEAQEYHRKEYQRLRAKFVKETRPPEGGDAALDRGGAAATGNDQTSGRDAVRNGPRLRDTFSDD